MIRRHNSKLAFSIVELSVVTLVIAILVGIVANTSGLVSSASLATARSLTKFSPVNDLSDNLALWFETTMPQSIDDINESDGEFVSTWYDISNTKESPHNATVATSSAPTYIKDGMNGLPVLRFGADDVIDNDYLNIDMSPLNNNNYTLFFVLQRRVAGTNYIFGSYGGGEDGIYIRYQNNSTTIRIRHDNVLGNDFYNIAGIGNYIAPEPTIFVFDYNKTLTTNNVHAYQNGSIVDTDTIDQYPDLSIGTQSAFGRYNNSSANYYKGDLAEVIMFNRLLSDAERKDIERYLGKKWGIDVES